MRQEHLDVAVTLHVRRYSRPHCWHERWDAVRKIGSCRLGRRAFVGAKSALALTLLQRLGQKSLGQHKYVTYLLIPQCSTFVAVTFSWIDGQCCLKKAAFAEGWWVVVGNQRQKAFRRTNVHASQYFQSSPGESFSPQLVTHVAHPSCSFRQVATTTVIADVWILFAGLVPAGRWAGWAGSSLVPGLGLFSLSLDKFKTLHFSSETVTNSSPKRASTASNTYFSGVRCWPTLPRVSGVGGSVVALCSPWSVFSYNASGEIVPFLSSIVFVW